MLKKFMCFSVPQRNKLKSAERNRILGLPSRGPEHQHEFLLHKVFENLLGQGHPCPTSWTSAPISLFSCGPGGEKQASGAKGLDVRRKIQPQGLSLALVQKALRKYFENKF